jgi:site-specific recombinase XerD
MSADTTPGTRWLSPANEATFNSYRRHLRSLNRSPRTIQGYEEAALQLEQWIDGADLLDAGRDDVQDYINDLLDWAASATATNRYRSLSAFYNWAVREELLDHSPMAKMKKPTETQRPVDVIADTDLRALLATCEEPRRDLEDARDEAIIRTLCEPGSPRVSELCGLELGTTDLRRDMIRVHGKGDKIRDIPIGLKTAKAWERYLRLRAKHPLASSPLLLLGRWERGPLTPSGVRQMLNRRTRAAGIGHVHPHQLRHTAAHIWKLGGGSEEDMMYLFGWDSPEMPRRYGASARTERAQRAARAASQADRL